MTNDEYWLARWLDGHDIRNRRSAERFLKDPRHIEELCTTLSEIPFNTEPLDGTDGTAIVAGRTIDLSGGLGCFHPECLQKDVDRLFSRAWHYFDVIVVEGLTPQHAYSLIAEGAGQSLEGFLGFVENFFYIRKIGAENMLIYQEKPHACVVHLREHAEEYRVTGILEEREAWIRSFAKDAEIGNLSSHEDHWHYYVTHPKIEHFAEGSVHGFGPDEKPDSSEIFGAIFDEYAAELMSDIVTARHMRSPLGAAAAIHERLLAESPVDSVDVPNALFSLDLPTISNLTAKELIKIRQANGEYFEAFRLALRSAAKQIIANASDGTSAADIASQIKNEVIEPELVRIRRELRAAADTFTRKSAVALPVTSLATTVGLLDKIPMVALGAAAIVGAAGVGTSLIDYKKYIDDKRAVLMSDMYFLWNAQRIADRARH